MSRGVLVRRGNQTPVPPRSLWRQGTGDGPIVLREMFGWVLVRGGKHKKKSEQLRRH